MIGRVERREKADVAQVRVHWEDALPQVLRAFQILQQPCHEHTALGAHSSSSGCGPRSVLTREDDDLIDAEDRARACDLPHQAARARRSTRGRRGLARASCSQVLHGMCVAPAAPPAAPRAAASSGWTPWRASRAAGCVAREDAASRGYDGKAQ
eukprot:scaffold193651_cov30-Tisochrysis_lutea.AAC.2